MCRPTGEVVPAVHRQRLDLGLDLVDPVGYRRQWEVSPGGLP